MRVYIKTHYYLKTNGYDEFECIRCYYRDYPHYINHLLFYNKMLFFKDGKYYVTPVAIVSMYDDSWIYYIGGYKTDKYFNDIMKPFWIFRQTFRMRPNIYYFPKETELLSKKQYEVWMQEYPGTEIFR